MITGTFSEKEFFPNFAAYSLNILISPADLHSYISYHDLTLNTYRVPM